MASINLIKGSDGTGNAATAIVSTLRAPSASTLIVSTVDNIPATFYASMGTPHTFTDPVTGETITVISEATAVDFRGHVDGINLEIDAIAPGYTDAGSAVGDIIVIRPITEWANNVADVLAEEHKDDGTHSDITATSITATTGTFTNLTIAGTASAEGWSPLGATPNTITANGNRSYDLVFNGTDLTDTITEGMRVRTARTVASPIQCATFDGTNDYFSKSSPASMTFTDDFVVSAWVKASSYATSIIIGRTNGSSGWDLVMDSSGTINLSGYNGALGNNRAVYSYQSIPLNKWVHITAQLDMSAHTATPTTSYIMFDGVDVPAAVRQGGSNPTALVQAGNLEIGSRNGTYLFPGKIAQVAIYSAKVTQATIKASMNQGLTGSETNLVSAYSLSNSLEDLSANNNDLTANGGVLATTADSPFGNSGVSTTLDYGVVMAKSFSTNTTLTIQVPEGCTIPTSGGVSSVDYSTQAVPYGFPRDKGRWYIVCLNKTFNQQALPVVDTWYNTGALILHLPAGNWSTSYTAQVYVDRAAAGGVSIVSTLSTSASSETDARFSIRSEGYSVTAVGPSHSVRGEITTTVLTGYYLLIKTVTTPMLSIYTLGERGLLQIVGEPSLL